MLERSAPNLELNAGSGNGITGRRVLFASLVVATIASLLVLAAKALSAGGFTAVDGLLLVLFGCTLPWSVIGFWNATVGFVVMRFARDPLGTVLPAARNVRGDEPITASTAIAIFVRNEPPDRVIRNLDAMMRELVAAGVADRFHLYVLSDTSIADVAKTEEEAFGKFADQWRDHIPVVYRRRDVNTAFKAGNFWDFLQRWGDDHEFAVTLDTDSFMTANAIMKMVRLAQSDPKLGILQGLVGGLRNAKRGEKKYAGGERRGPHDQHRGEWTAASAGSDSA